MAMQTFTVVIGMVDVDGVHRRSEIVDVDMVQPVQLAADRAIHGVIGVTRIAGFIRWNPVILEMTRWDIGGVVHV